MDILAIDTTQKKAYLIDPTVRFESNLDVGALAHEEKKATYDPCIPFLKERYKEHGQCDWEVIGLWVGARGAISAQMVEFFDRFQLDQSVLVEISEKVLKASLLMLHHHMYG